MKTLLCGAAALLVLAGPAFAQEVEAPSPDPATEAPAAAPEAPPIAADPNVYQVLRTGDREMSCEALGAEANALNATLLADAQKAQKGAGAKQFGRSVAGGVTGGAMKVGGRMMLGRVIGGMTPFGGLVAVAANDAIADAAAQKIASGPSETAPAAVSPEQQRMNHLLGLYREKGC